VERFPFVMFEIHLRRRTLYFIVNLINLLLRLEFPFFSELFIKQHPKSSQLIFLLKLLNNFF
jgi:hypothetical protein